MLQLGRVATGFQTLIRTRYDAITILSTARMTATTTASIAVLTHGHLAPELYVC
jgi:hypothetical protein